uniref:Solute carrier family 26 member 6 n=1 Tax=Nothobranchius furzeri TaxID=105023 RepID=A0A8C6LG20_NOTFU
HRLSACQRSADSAQIYQDMADRCWSSGDFVVHREVLDENRLDEVAQKGTWCSVPKLKHMVLTWIPILAWLPGYSFRENAMGDLISGCSVGIMHLPQGMAYAFLASVRPVFGLYTSLYPVLIYFIFGTSRHISIGTFAVISIMVGGVTERLAPDSDFMTNGTNRTVNIDARDSYRVQVACSLTALAGIFQILLGIVRFGFVVTYLSEPLARGYTTAAACHVCVSQLKYLFGVRPARFAGPFAIIYTLVDICKLLPQTRAPELVISLVAITVLIVVKEINERHRQKLPLPFPIELLVVSHSLKAPRAPDPTLFSQIIGDAFAVAIVGYAITISLGKTFALKHGYKVDSNQELVAVGLCNAIGACFWCYAVTSSLSRSLVQESTGGRTQIAGVVSSVVVLIAVLKIGSLFEDLPKAVLSTIVFVNLKGMFKQFMDVSLLWKTNKVDLLVWLVTFVSTILLNLDMGLAVSIGFSMLTIIFRAQVPRYSILGNVPDTDLYLDMETYRAAREIPGIKIIRSSATINFTNAEMYREFLQEKVCVCVCVLTKEKCNQTEVALDLTNTSPSKGQVNWAYQADTNMSDSDSDSRSHTDEAPEVLYQGDETSTFRSDIHSVILDMSTTSSVDTVTVKFMKTIFREFKEVDMDIYLASCQGNDHTRQNRWLINSRSRLWSHSSHVTEKNQKYVCIFVVVVWLNISVCGGAAGEG